jgi:hypothetical protein
MNGSSEGGAGMRDAQSVQSEILKVISEDPTIADAQHVFVTVESAGLFKGRTLVLKGHVRSETDKAKIASVAQVHAAGYSVRDALTVVH